MNVPWTCSVLRAHTNYIVWEVTTLSIPISEGDTNSSYIVIYYIVCCEDALHKAEGNTSDPTFIDLKVDAKSPIFCCLVWGINSYHLT